MSGTIVEQHQHLRALLTELEAADAIAVPSLLVKLKSTLEVHFAEEEAPRAFDDYRPHERRERLVASGATVQGARLRPLEGGRARGRPRPAGPRRAPARPSHPPSRDPRDGVPHRRALRRPRRERLSLDSALVRGLEHRAPPRGRLALGVLTGTRPGPPRLPAHPMSLCPGGAMGANRAATGRTGRSRRPAA